ncbi:hypothetical protein PAMC26577_38285 [Caballeronia sordidicola]|uniref:Uncharacterized protein n=1 Tax=Caballeronia sordidicola TaxID=196367 RepID=A0A242M4K7_CABSO|nr:hypothetical protein PAMC26577_38285 [Caballeronia sordidicola]
MRRVLFTVVKQEIQSARRWACGMTWRVEAAHNATTGEGVGLVHRAGYA